MKKVINTIGSILFLYSFVSISFLSAQNTFVISSGYVKMNGGSLVLKDTKFTNNGTFQSGTSTTVIEGSTTNANAAIGGTTPTTFYNLKINKTANGTQLNIPITISNQLTLTKGNIDIQANNLTIANTGTISGGSANSFIKTSGVGLLTQQVNASNVVFPIGNQSFTPITLNNTGTTDNFNIRVDNTVYQNGTSGSISTTDVVDATWYIDETIAGGSNVALTFQWNGSDELTNFDRTQSFVSYYNNGMWNDGTSQAASGSDPYMISENGISSFSPFKIASNNPPLPVELLYFYGEQQNENVLLNWETATEINNDYFDIEWSTNGIEFQKIGQMQGAGTVTEQQSYEFLHENPLYGENYYRLKQVDIDGQFEYTNIILITFEFPITTKTNNFPLSIYPNPTSRFLTIENNRVGEMAQIIGANGQVLREFQIQSTHHKLSVSTLVGGIYFIKLGTDVRKVIIIK